jgi:hypothetical protein
LNAGDFSDGGGVEVVEIEQHELPVGGLKLVDQRHEAREEIAFTKDVRGVTRIGSVINLVEAMIEARARLSLRTWGAAVL